MEMGNAVLKFHTEIPELDIVIGGGSIPVPSIIELFGGKDTSKSSIALLFLVRFIKETGGRVLYIDSEFKMDEKRFKYVVNYLHNIQENDFELLYENDIDVVFEVINKFIKKNVLEGKQSMIILDTVANLIINSKSDGSSGYSGAKVVSKLTEKLAFMSSKIFDTKSFFLILNQIRDNVSGMGKKYKIPRGRQLEHIVKAILKFQSPSKVVTKIGNIEVEEGKIVSFIAEKNHIFLSGLKSFVFVDEKGIDILRTIYEQAIARSIIKKSGSWKIIEYGNKVYKIHNFRSFKKLVSENPDILEYIKYQFYILYSTLTPLTKVKLIDYIWEYEEKLNLPKTELSESELIIYNSINNK